MSARFACGWRASPMCRLRNGCSATPPAGGRSGGRSSSASAAASAASSAALDVPRTATSRSFARAAGTRGCPASPSPPRLPPRPAACRARPKAASAIPSRGTDSAAAVGCTQTCILEYAGAVLQATASLDLASLGAAYAEGRLRPTQLVGGIVERLAQRGQDPTWIHLVPRAELEARAAELERRGARELPLYGIPFAIKDNIDLAEHPTTAACPQFAYVARESAAVVERLLAAGAILVGKTNLDQFATGLVGVRSPYGVPANSFDPAYIPGGSSSGSAVAVAVGLVSFSLGTDTAGSGRVPAAFNNLVGLKPTRGLLSTRGVVPACRSLDCVSIFAKTCADAERVWSIARGGAREP